MHMYPISLHVTGRQALVVGGGEVARRKVGALLAAGAQVRVVAPELCPGLAELAHTGRVGWHRGRYETADLDGVWLVIGATDDPDVNAQVAAEAEARGLLVNIVDQPDLCNFTVPAVLQRGGLTIAVSTGGSSPALARRLREELEERYGPAYGVLSDLLGELRPRVRESIPEQQGRQALWEAILDSAALELIADGRTEDARRLVEQLVSAHGGDV